MASIVTVDVGTTSIKFCFIGADGEIAQRERVATPTIRDHWGEVYDAESIITAVADFIRTLPEDARRSVGRIAVAGVGESGGLVRGDGTLASPLILWHDHRAAGLLETLTREDRARVYEITGLPVNANYSLSKIRWCAERSGDVGDARWLNVAEYIAAVLTGQRWAEPSLASRTMALDVRTGEWSAEMCDLLGVSLELLPELRDARNGSPLRADISHAWGMQSVLVHVAGHDHMVGAVGADLRPGEMLDSTGTTEGLLVLGPTPTLGPETAASKLSNGRAVEGDLFTLFASIPTGGSAFATLQGLLGGGPDHVRALTASAHARYVADHVALDRLPLVLPRFRGSPPPSKDASARGAIANISGDTTAEDLVLGCFLGLVRQFSDVLALFPVQPERLKVIGPAVLNPLWLQLKADLLGTALTASAETEVVSRGAAAAAGGGRVPWVASGARSVDPDPARTARLGQWVDASATRWRRLGEVS